MEGCDCFVVHNVCTVVHIGVFYMIMLSLKSSCVTKAVCSVPGFRHKLQQIASFIFKVFILFYFCFESVLFSIVRGNYRLHNFSWYCSVPGTIAAIAVLNCDVTTLCDHKTRTGQEASVASYRDVTNSLLQRGSGQRQAMEMALHSLDAPIGGAVGPWAWLEHCRQVLGSCKGCWS